VAKESWKSLSTEELNQWRQLCSDFPKEPFYKLVSQSQLPASMPTSLKEKIINAVLMTSGTPQGDVVMVCNLCRIDTKDAALDQQPFAIVFDSHRESGSGMYLNHGDWRGRTTSLSDEFWKQVEQSGISGCFYPTVPDGKLSGTLDSLSNTSNGDAFAEMIKRLCNHKLIDRNDGEGEQVNR